MKGNWLLSHREKSKGRKNIKTKPKKEKQPPSPKLTRKNYNKKSIARMVFVLAWIIPKSGPDISRSLGWRSQEAYWRSREEIKKGKTFSNGTGMSGGHCGKPDSLLLGTLWETRKNTSSNFSSEKWGGWLGCLSTNPCPSLVKDSSMGFNVPTFSIVWTHWLV